MINESTLYTPLHESTLLHTPNILLIANYDFSYVDLLKELPRDVIVLFHALKKAYETQDPQFYHILNDEKKWDTAVLKYAHYKLKPQQFDEVFEEVLNFFNQVNSPSLIFEMAHYFKFASYQVETNHIWFLFDDFVDGKPLAFSKERIQDEKIVFQQGTEQEITLSPQTFLFIRLLDVSLTNRLQKFKLKADVDTTLPDYIQLLHHVCLDEKKSHAYFLSLERPLISLLEVMISYHKLARLLADYETTLEAAEQKQIIQQMMPQIEVAIYRFTATLYLHFNNTRRKQEEKATQIAKRKTEEITKRFDRQKEKYEELRKQNQELRKVKPAEVVTTTQIVTDHSDALKKLAEERIHLQKFVKQLENTISSNEGVYTNKLEDLKRENKGLQQKLQPLLKIVQEPRIETIAQWLALGQKLVQNITETEEADIRAFFDLFLKICDEQKVATPKQEIASNLYGYVSISSRGHHVHFPNGQDAIIEGIPARIYLADGQFVQVTTDFNYVAHYGEFFDYHLKETTAQFSVVRMQDAQPHVFSNGALHRLSHEPHIHLREGQIVSFNSNKELIRFYRQQPLQLNLFEQSIALKEHTPYYVQRVLPTGAVVTNVLTNEESYATFEQLDKLRDGAFITTSGQTIVRIFQGAFYKLSTYYTKSEIVSVCEIDDECFAKKLNREMIIIQNIPSNVAITLHSHVRIDELHNYLEVVKEDATVSDTIEQRRARRPITTTKQMTPLAPVETIAEVLIVGNPSFFASYKQKLAASGIAVTGINGYDSFSRVKQEVKDKDYIVVCTEFVSHDNMYAIKDFYSASKIIYSDRDGATQILQQLNAKITG